MELLGNLLLFSVVGLIVWVLIFLGLTYYLIKRNRAQLRTLYSQKLTFAPTNFTQSPKMNRGFFDQNTTLFLQMDFTPIGDFTIPQLPTENYNRALFHSSYYTYALMSQMRVRGFWAALTKNLPPWLEFITTFEDGSSLTTTTNAAAGAMARRPEAMLQKALWTSPPEVFNQHIQVLQDLMSKGKTPRPVSLEGFFVAFQEGFRREGEFRQKQGYLRPEEVQAIARERGKPVEGKIMAWMLGKIDKG